MFSPSHLVIMARKVYYVYNRDSLSYERVFPSLKDRIFIIIRHLATGVVFGLITFFGMMYIFDSPHEAILRKENKLLMSQYDMLSVQLKEAMEVLVDLQQRDENLYRAIFQTESIPESVRKSGVGGADRYKHLMELSNSALVISTTRRMDMLRKQLYVQSNSLEELINTGKNLEERSKCIPAIQPIANKNLNHTASGYGMRIDPIYRVPRFHSGMDFSARIGTDIYVTGNGSVSFSGWRQGYGNCIIVEHGYGYRTLYGHLSRFRCKRGERVVRGQVIGEVGNTGKSTGPHLHYEVIVNGKYDNPAKYYFMDLSPEEYDRMLQLAENHGQVMD